MMNWKTTLAGLVAGIPTIIVALVNAYQSGQFSGENIGQVIAGASLIVLGLIAKDFDTTGGTPTTPATKS